MDDIKKAVEERVKQEEALMSEAESDSVSREAESAFILDCYRANTLGDGMLYAYLQRNKYVHNNNTGQMYKWLGHSWGLDYMNSHLGAVDEVARRYLEEADNLWEKIKLCEGRSEKERLEKLQEGLRKRANRLRTVNGRDNCVKFAVTLEEDPLAVRGEVFDSNPLLLACKNGVVDLKTGLFRDGRPEDYISLACPVEFKGLDAPAELWEEKLLEIFDGNKKVVAYIQRLFGYGITGLNTMHIFPVLQGRGRNGKSMIIDVIKYVLGPLAAPISAEMLLNQPYGKNSSAPSPDIMALKGLRIAFASEVNERSSFSSAQVKLLTGGDSLSARNPHDKYQTHFTPSHLLILLTNDKPRAPDHDFAFWERLHLVKFPLSFVSNPKEPHERKAEEGLAEKLKSLASGILAWMIRGYLECQAQNGLNPPEEVLEATSEYRREEDTIGEFIEDCCVVDGAVFVGATELYEAFEKWHELHKGKRVPSQKWFGKRMGDRFKRVRGHGPTRYQGIGLLAE